MPQEDSEDMYTEEYFIRLICEQALRSVKISLPAKIVKINLEKQQVDVQPLIQMRKIATREIISRAVVKNVPFIFPKTSTMQITFPIKIGDEGLLIYSHRDISNWKNVGGEQPISSNNLFRENDCFFQIGISSEGKYVSEYDPDNLVIVKDDQKITIGNGIIDAPDFEVNVKRLTASDDVVASNISLKQHKHSGATLQTTATVGSSGTPGQISGNTDVPQ